MHQYATIWYKAHAGPYKIAPTIEYFYEVYGLYNLIDFGQLALTCIHLINLH